MYYNKCSREVNTLRKDFQIGSTIEKWGFSSAGRAPALHAGGQEFESPILHHFNTKTDFKIGLCVCFY